MPETDVMKLRVVGGHSMHCSGCERSVEFILSSLAGVREVKADHRTQLIQIAIEPGAVHLAKAREELEWLGHQVEPVPAGDAKPAVGDQSGS